MANTVIQLKYSSLTGNIPSSLANGELAINYADGTLYYKNTTGHIVGLQGAGNVYSFSTINVNNSLITALSNNSVLNIRNGDNISISGDIINDIITISANLKPAFDVANAAFAAANTAAGGAGNSFTTISVAGQTNIVASANDTLTFAGANGINISTDSVSKTLTIIAAPALNFTDYGSIEGPITTTQNYGSL